jgi:hypothetical protein
MERAETDGATGLSDGRPIRAPTVYACSSRRHSQGDFPLSDVHNIPEIVVDGLSPLDPACREFKFAGTDRQEIEPTD